MAPGVALAMLAGLRRDLAEILRRDEKSLPRSVAWEMLQAPRPTAPPPGFYPPYKR